jgi:hypothetical protein
MYLDLMAYTHAIYCNVNEKNGKGAFDSFRIYKQVQHHQRILLKDALFVDTLKMIENLLSPNWYKKLY